AFDANQLVILSLLGTLQGQRFQQPAPQSLSLQLRHWFFQSLLPVGRIAIGWILKQSQVGEQILGATLVTVLVKHDEVKVGIEQLANFGIEPEELFVQQWLRVPVKQVGQNVLVELKIALLVGDMAIFAAGNDLESIENIKNRFVFI